MIPRSRSGARAESPGRGWRPPRLFWSLWQAAFPDCRCDITRLVVEGSDTIQYSTFSGTHTETFHMPTGEAIPATGRSVSVPYSLALASRGGRWTDFDLIFDQVELMTQLGLMPAQAPART